VKRPGSIVIHHTATTQQALATVQGEMLGNYTNHHHPIHYAPVQLTHQQLGIQTNVFITLKVHKIYACMYRSTCISSVSKIM
jgi:ribosomal protein L24